MNFSTQNDKKMDELCVNTIRILSMDAVQKANSGHPGAPMGLAAAGYILWTRILKHNPSNPDWQNRDRFILSGGHASMLIYSLLYLSGYDLTLDDIKQFRQMGSKTPGHPEYGNTAGIETTTGPLGQGFANAVGIAIAERHLASIFNKSGYNIVDHHTYVFCGDGDLMEGISYESASIAGHLGLGKLICLYDSNGITIDGSTEITFTENIKERFSSCNWHVLQVEKVNDLDLIENAFKIAKEEKEKPSIIILKSNIAYGSPNLQDNPKSHGAPLGEKEIYLTRKALKWTENEPFVVPNEVISFFINSCKKGSELESSWLKLYKDYSSKFPKLANDWLNGLTRFMPNDWDSDFPNFEKSDKPISTRVISGKIINLIANKIPNLMGGSADLTPSNKTYIESSYDFQKQSYDGRNIRFGVREFSMGGIIAGLFLHGGIRPYGGTFLVFSDYMRSSIRMSSIMKLPIIYIFTHDSIAVGEDGPTHQPVEHLAALRSIPNLVVLRPADANETLESWRIAMLSNDKPVALILSRQELPIITSEKISIKASRGAYVISDCKKSVPDILILSSGSEVHIAIESKLILESNNVAARVISMPSWELFEEQPKSYQERILPSNVKFCVAIEAGISMGWDKYIKNKGFFIGVDEFGISAPGSLVMDKFGINSNYISNKILELVNGN